MKLKTLKDIKEDFLQNKGYDILCPTAIKLLKQEAIKDYKKFSMKTESGIEMSNVANYIKWKFNLIGKDLK